jgi:hypothetical protein
MGNAGSVVPLVLSACAVILSAAAFVTRRRQDKRDLFLRMFEILIQPELQEGRRLLYDRVHSIQDVIELRNNEPDAYALINRALAMFEVFGMYVERGYIDRDLALEEWGRTYARCFLLSSPFVEDRRKLQGHSFVWPHLHSFGREAVAWRNARHTDENRRKVDRRTET